MTVLRARVDLYRKQVFYCRKIAVDCSQPSIFSYFYSIVKRADRIEREVDASAKGGGGGGTEKKSSFSPRSACLALALSRALNN